MAKPVESMQLLPSDGNLQTEERQTRAAYVCDVALLRLDHDMNPYKRSRYTDEEIDNFMFHTRPLSS